MKRRGLPGFWLRFVTATTVLAGVPVAHAADMPAAMQVMVGGMVQSPAQTAGQNVLALNTAMFGLYGDSSRTFRDNILAQHPVILALFSGAGGELTLYRPGRPPLVAPPVPPVYQILKSVGHATMVLGVIAGPHLDKPADQSWVAPLQAYRARMQAALSGLDQVDMPADWRADSRDVLGGDIAFMDDCLAKGEITFPALQRFTATQGPKLKKLITWAAQTQVRHWMDVVGGWKKDLGPDWNNTYAASNTIYVARQNNVLFSVLAQFFAPDAINDRLMLIETMSFTTTKDDMLDSMTRIISDRIVGTLFFGNDHLMDFELMGGDARDAILAEAKARGATAFLPPAVPFGSHQWPTLVTPGEGPASLAQLH